MIENDFIIRNETPADYDEVESLVRESFWNVYRPGCLEHYVLHCLRKDEAAAEAFDKRFPEKQKLRLKGQLV